MPESRPTQHINAMRWSEDGMFIYALREVPVDSAGWPLFKDYVEKYTPQGSLLSSVYEPMGCEAFTPDCQHLINGPGFTIDKIGDSVRSLPQTGGWPLASSPSGHLVLTDSVLIEIGGVSTSNHLYQLLWIDSDRVRIIKRWLTIGQSQTAAVLSDGLISMDEYLNDSSYFFSIYDTSLKLLFRTPDPYMRMQGIGYVPSLNSVLVNQGSQAFFINLETGQGRKVLDGAVLLAAPDGFHALYIHETTFALLIRNLITGAEKILSTDDPRRVYFSPDAQYVSYILEAYATVKSVPVNGLP